MRALLRHFRDLRDGRHGPSAVTRDEKERLFHTAVDFLDVFARQVLEEMNEILLLGTGSVSATGVIRSYNGDVTATWFLSWPEQKQRQIQPVTLQAVFGWRFLHPHLRGITVSHWPLNVFSESDAADELPILRAIAGADLHNLVFESDYRIIPAVTAG
jgi:hypothetical protein